MTKEMELAFPPRLTSSKRLKDRYESPEDCHILDSFLYIGGRRYHNIEGVGYPLPNDCRESERLQLLHYVYRSVFRGNFSAPVASILERGRATVLDIGCGSGTWTQDLANTYMGSVFIGIDISPMFPSESARPSNAGFLECNVLNGIPFPDETFDFTHQRSLRMAFTRNNWHEVIDEIIRVTKPGGWIEFCEMDVDFTNLGPMMGRFLEATSKLSHSLGIDPSIIPHLEGFLKDTGKVSDIQIIRKPVPLGSWGGRLGELILQDAQDEVAGIAAKIAPLMGENMCAEKVIKLSEYLDEELTQYNTSCSYVKIWCKKIEN